MESSDPICHRDNYESFFSTFTDQQKKIHNIDDDSLIYDDNKEQQTINSYFNLEDDKTMWSYSYSQNMTLKGTQDCDNTIDSKIADVKYTFVLDNTPHVIFNSQIEQSLPSIVFQDGYEGKWCPDILVVIFKSGTFFQENNIIGVIDSIYNLEQIDKEDYYKKAVINKSIGNSNILQEFSTIIPSVNLKFRPPWCYNEPGKCYPILFTGKKDELKHEIVMIKNIEKLLIIRNIETGLRVDKISDQCIKKINGSKLSDSNSILSHPSMVGFYAYKDLKECDEERNKCSDLYNYPNSNQSIHSISRSVNGDLIRQVPYSFFIKDRMTVCSAGSVKLGSTVDLELTFNKNTSPFKFEWFVQNQTAVKNNNYTNGSTNAEDSNKGFNTFDKISIKINDKYIIKNTKGDRFCELGCHPSEYMILKNGSGIYTTAVSDRGMHSGNALKTVKLTIELKNMNPYLNLDDENNDVHICNDRFKVYFMATYYKELTFNEYPRNDDERAIKNSNITIV